MQAAKRNIATDSEQQPKLIQRLATCYVDAYPNLA